MEKIYLGAKKLQKGERPMRGEAEAQNMRKAGRFGEGHEMRAGRRNKKDTGSEKPKMNHAWIFAGGI